MAQICLVKTFTKKILTEVDVIDEDDMASNLNTKVPTQQSVKAYVDNKAILHL